MNMETIVVGKPGRKMNFIPREITTKDITPIITGPKPIGVVEQDGIFAVAVKDYRGVNLYHGGKQCGSTPEEAIDKYRAWYGEMVKRPLMPM
jgi:hypothetical protein